MILIGVLHLLLLLPVNAQPQISYLIPDIGTPEMNTYVEIIAPVSQFNAFSPNANDNKGLMAPSTVEVEVFNPADTQRIIISPVVVGWDGRLISCQFFVKPNAATGPVPIRVRVNNTYSNVDTFYIVSPQQFGTKNGSGVIGSGGAWGTRSKRGAMIVDSMILNTGTYTIETSDTDPGTAGEQGFLPCIIISKGPIRIAQGVVVSASATDKNGGPGGGGGGGYGQGWTSPIPTLSVPGERNFPLGSGFTGGRSDLPFISSPPSSFGKGTGTDTRSLNDARANDNFTTTFPTLARLYGAGPGHPFDHDGRSGGAAAATGGANLGAFGTDYGGGGNATSGGGLPVSQSDINGQVIGNKEIVPLHGGGGGVSGGPGDSVGAGGGGGIALYSMLTSTISDVYADGADGSDGCDNCGPGSGDAAAGGAGGSVTVGGKHSLEIRTVKVEGGVSGRTQPSAPLASTSGDGGIGRFRHDGRIGSLTLTSQASLYAGPTIDTFTFANRRAIKLRGTGRYVSGAEKILLYQRGENGRWSLAPTVATVRQDSTWEADIALPNDSLVYVFALQETPRTEHSVDDTTTRVPTHVFSQSAANIIRYQPIPELNAPSQAKIDTIYCPDIIFDTIFISNVGDEDLTIDASSGLLGSSGGRFNILSPTFPITIAPGTQEQIIVQYDMRTAPLGLSVDTLRLFSNDPEPGKSPWDIEVGVFNAYRSNFTPDPANPPTITFGDVPVGSIVERRIVIHNTAPPGGPPLIVDSLWTKPPTIGIKIVSQSIPENTPIAPGDSLVITVRFAPESELDLTGKCICVRISSPCRDTICWPITGRGVASSIEPSKPELTMEVQLCDPLQPVRDSVVIRNPGSAPIELRSLSVMPADFTIISPMPSQLPITIPPGGQLTLTVQFTPTTGPPFTVSGTLELTTDNPLTPVFSLGVTGRENWADFELSHRELNVVFSACESSSIDTMITIRNTGAVDMNIGFIGTLPPGASLSPPPPYSIPPGRDTMVTIRYAPGQFGPFDHILQFAGIPCVIIDSIRLHGEWTPSATTIAPQPLDFGSLPSGIPTQRVVNVTNPSQATIRIASARIVPPNPQLRIVPTTTFPVRLGPGLSQPVTIEYTPTQQPIPSGTRLEVVVDSMCTDTLYTNITGQGIVTGIELSKTPVDFGPLLNCITLEDTVYIRNTGSQEVVLTGLNVTPSPTFDARIASGSSTTRLSTGDSAAVIVTFSPTTGPDGPKNGLLKVATDDPVIDSIAIPLLGQRTSESLIFSGQNFNPTAEGSTDQIVRYIDNNGTEPVTISTLNAPPPFAVTATRPPLPVTLNPGERLEIDLTFIPTEIGEFNEALDIAPAFRCGTLPELPLYGRTLIAIVANTQWGTISGAPGQSVLLPLELGNSVGSADVKHYTVDAEFNGSMLLPRRVVLEGTLSDGWNVVDTQIDSGSISFSAMGLTPIQGPGVLAYVEMLVLLGNDLSTPITSSQAAAIVEGTAIIDVDPGMFTLEGYCEVGGNRLVRITNEFGIKSVTPNPTNDRITVEFELVEDGPTSLKLFDVLGRHVGTILEQDMKANPHRVQVQLEQPSGLYILELTTRTQKDNSEILIRD